MKNVLNFFISAFSALSILLWLLRLEQGANQVYCNIFIGVPLLVLLLEFLNYHHKVCGDTISWKVEQKE